VVVNDASDPGDGTDPGLLEAHLRGDTEAFGLLFRRHRDRLWAVALRTTGNPEDAADALQEAMIAAFRRADSYRGDAQVSTWLHRIVVNACLDRRRRNRVRAAQPLPDDLEEYAGRGAVTPASGGSADAAAGDPEARALAEERRSLVLAGLRRLPAEQRAALVLVDMHGLSVEEAASALHCAPGTVKSRCSRGRARLAMILAEAGLGEAGRGGTRSARPPSQTAGGATSTEPSTSAGSDEGGATR
jgi:RNA polymerase sigma-70 factor, ECF subfamily